MSAPSTPVPMIDAEPIALEPSIVRKAIAETQPGNRVSWLAQHLGQSDEYFYRRAAEYFCLLDISMQQLRGLDPDFSILSFAECQRRGCFAARNLEGRAVVVIVDPTDLQTMKWIDLRMRFGGYADFQLFLASMPDFHATLAIAEKSVRAMDAVVSGDLLSDNDSTKSLSISMLQIDAAESPVVRLVDSTLHDALRVGASDIHMETQPGGLIIKYRIDGVLEVVKQLDNIDLAHQAISRIKVVSDLDIAERRIPQDGRFRVDADGRDIDFRVSIMPNLFGEDAVLRVLDRKHLTGQFRALTLDTLSFTPGVREFIRETSTLPYGLLLVTGPTGSGKTTTLYAAISEINRGIDKIVTIEDPIEYQLPGVLQIPVNERKGLTFARGLRSVLRHDPDKIMVGEIRDAETAQIAVQAALTGHQVFTTVHANNVFDVIGRFANMGLDNYSLVAALNGIIAQRLVRENCHQCSVPVAPSKELLKKSRIYLDPMHDDTEISFKRGQGCAHCRGTGYKGRRAIAETLKLTDALRNQMVQRVPLSELRNTARADGFISLREAAIALASKGLTSLEEINRVTPIE